MIFYGVEIKREEEDNNLRTTERTLGQQVTGQKSEKLRIQSH